MTKKVVRISCKVQDRAPLESLTPFQGNLKSLSEANYKKLKKQIRTQGFSFPVFVWVCDGKHHLLDGHQRVRVLHKMQHEGWQIPEIPVVRVLAEDYQAAKQKLLSATSQYGEIEGQGLYEFITDAALTPDYLTDNLRLPELDLESFRAEFFECPPQAEEEPEKKEKKPKECPHCGELL